MTGNARESQHFLFTELNLKSLSASTSVIFRVKGHRWQPRRVPTGCQAVKRETSHLPVNCLRSLWHQMSLESSWATIYVVAILVLITLIYLNGPPIALNRKLGVSAKARIGINHLRLWHGAHKLWRKWSEHLIAADRRAYGANRVAKSVCFADWPSIRPLLDFSQVDARSFDLQY